MNKYPLSSAAERLFAVVISAVLILFMVLLCILLSGDLLSLIICVIASALVGLALLFYVVNLLKASVIPNREDSILEIKGIPDSFVYTLNAVSLETMAFQNGPVSTRTMVFRDADGEVVASVPTFFTANKGAMAEPLAMELASVMGIAFCPSLAPWEYDKEQRKAHQKELALEEKEQRREKMRSLKEKILRRTKTGEPAFVHSEEEVSVSDSEDSFDSDGINYDALDDEK